MQKLQNIFESIGGEFVSPLSVIADKISDVKAFVFDWDGVFNDGTKHPEFGSPFSEVDAMATNMLRFGYYLTHGEVPHTLIISGEKNVTASTLATRERFNAFYARSKNKVVALRHFMEQTDVKPGEICFFFDDILDLSLAREVGLKIQISHPAKPIFNEYVKAHQMSDYITGNPGGQGGVREATEMLLAAQGIHDLTVGKRVDFEGAYTYYLEKRQAQETLFYTYVEGQIIKQ